MSFDSALGVASPHSGRSANIPHKDPRQMTLADEPARCRNRIKRYGVLVDEALREGNPPFSTQ